MEDIMLIRSSFLRRIISQVINKILKKQLPGTEVQLGEVQVNWSEKEQKLKIHLVVDAEMTKAQLMDILKKADALDNAMKDQSPDWERKLYEFLRTNQAEKYLKR